MTNTHWTVIGAVVPGIVWRLWEWLDQRRGRVQTIPMASLEITVAYCPICRSDGWWTDDQYRKWAQDNHNKYCPGTYLVKVGNDRPCRGENSNVCVAEGCHGGACVDDLPFDEHIRNGI